MASNSGKAVSMRAISRATGVSIMTVSNVLNNKGRVGKKTKEKVLKKATELGYNKNVFYRFGHINRTGNTQPQGIIIHTFASVPNKHQVVPYMHMIYMHLADEFETMGHPCFFINHTQESSLERVVDTGVVLAFDKIGPSLKKILGGKSSPRNQASTIKKIVTVFFETNDSFSILPDNKKAGLMAAEYLANKGVKDVVIAGSSEYSDHIERISFFKEAYKGIDKGNKITDLSETCKDRSELQGALEKMLSGRKSELPSCIYAITADSALMVYHNCARNGINIPRDISLMGFDNAPLYDYLSIDITRLYYDFSEMTSVIKDSVLKGFTDEKVYNGTMLLPIYLIEGSSIKDHKA